MEVQDNSEDEIESDSEDENEPDPNSTETPSDEQPPEAKRAKTSETTGSRKEPSYMEVTVSNEGRDLMIAYFLNVPSHYQPDWDKIFPKHRNCFDTFVDLGQSVPAFTFKLTKEGKKKFRGSRKTVLFELGSLISVD